MGDARHILVVDGAEKVDPAFRDSLRRAGYDVGVAETAIAALEQIKEQEVELILLGESIPGMAGLDLLRLLRAAWTPHQLPVIVMSADSSEETEMAALEAGANDFVALSSGSTRALARVQSQFRQLDAGNGSRERAERVFRATSASADVVWEWNLATDCIWFSPEWNQLCGKRMTGPIKLADWLSLVHPDDGDAMQSALLVVRNNPDQMEFGQEYRICRPNGESRWIYCRANVERDRDGTLLRLTGLQTDITRNKCVDWLTQLPNREDLLSRVDVLLMPQQAEPFALLHINLDRFRIINESLGPSAGDRLLREVALRLERTVRTVSSSGQPDDHLARVHGDSFVLILRKVKTEAEARNAAEEFQAAIRRPLLLGDREIRLSASIGIVLSNSTAYERAFDILRDAESALNHAKMAGRARSVFYDPEMRREAMVRMDLEIDLRDALDRNQFELFYQPKVDLISGDLGGFEALLRWRHPNLGMINPQKFISIAEETGLILPIGAWAVQTAARQFSEWRRLRPELEMQVSVNLSVKQFFDRELIEIVAEAVKSADLPHGTLCLEVTESVLIGDTDLAADILRQLHGVGVGLMIDDFGTGYSSLNYLTQLPFDTLKIDRSFIKKVSEDRNCAAVVNAVVSLAKNLKMDVVAEGVEAADQEEHLKRIGCRYAQGYLFSKPVDVPTATAMILNPTYFKPAYRPA